MDPIKNLMDAMRAKHNEVCHDPDCPAHRADLGMDPTESPGWTEARDKMNQIADAVEVRDVDLLADVAAHVDKIAQQRVLATLAGLDGVLQIYRADPVRPTRLDAVVTQAATGQVDLVDAIETAYREGLAAARLLLQRASLTLVLPPSKR